MFESAASDKNCNRLGSYYMSNSRPSRSYLLKAAYSEYSSIEFCVRRTLLLSPTVGGLIEVWLFSQ